MLPVVYYIHFACILLTRIDASTVVCCGETVSRG